MFSKVVQNPHRCELFYILHNTIPDMPARELTYNTEDHTNTVRSTEVRTWFALIMSAGDPPNANHTFTCVM